MDIASCVCSTISIIDEIINIRAKMKNQDAGAIDDLLKLMKKYEKCSKNEKKLIRKTIEGFLEMNSSAHNSSAAL